MQPYFAMTPAELGRAPTLPGPIGWMSCHFDPKGPGLIDLPQQLPPGSVLFLDDSLPYSGQDFRQIHQEIEAVFSRLSPSALILDFQRPDCPELKTLAQSLPFPIVVSAPYAVPNVPILLPPLPADLSLRDYLAPWSDHSIWLELSLGFETVRLTKSGAQTLPLTLKPPKQLHRDADLHIHYWMTETGNSVSFHLLRTQSDVLSLLEEAAALGISGAVGLYQELWKA